MRNPWSELPVDPPFALPGDLPAIQRFNQRVHADALIHLELIPEPFLGRLDAPVVLLGLNPGFDDREVPLHSDNGPFVALSRANLIHAVRDYPFHLLHPQVSTSLGQAWWKAKLKEPILMAGLEAVAHNMLCVEYFPYHSKKFGAGRLRLPSQRYSVELARAAIARNAVVVIMRGAANWTSVLPELSGYARMFRLRSPQNVAISRANCPLGFEEIMRALS